MKTAEYGNETVECYQESDLEDEKFVTVCEQAKQLWEQRCREYLEKHGQKGSPVVGAGFTVWYLAPRARKPKRKMILHSPLGLQGSLTWEDSKCEIERFFQEHGIAIHYEWGAMD